MGTGGRRPRRRWRRRRRRRADDGESAPRGATSGRTGPASATAEVAKPCALVSPLCSCRSSARIVRWKCPPPPFVRLNTPPLAFCAKVVCPACSHVQMDSCCRRRLCPVLIPPLCELRCLPETPIGAPAHGQSDTSRGAAHRFLEQTLAPDQYTVPAHQPGAPRLRLLTFAVSVRGALGSEAQTFIRQLSARVAGAVPYRLLDEATTGPRRGAPLCSARRSPSRPAGRSLPASVGAPAPARRPPTLSAATISPPPTRRAASTARLTRLLLSSDLLRVAAWVAVGLCLGSGFLSLVVY